MESEKVKEIKNALEHCVIHDCSDSCIFSEKHPFACLTEMHKQLLTLINELEEENERLKGYRKNYSRTLARLKSENQQLKDRIAELEKENERLANRITCRVTIPDDKLEEIKKECLERVEVAKDKLLNQFAERLKEKIENCSGCYIPDCFESPTNEFAYSAIEVSNAIDETLNEFDVEVNDEN